jgi:hypothetical protein
MDKRTLGKTGMHVSPLGFGGAEIGFEGAAQDIVTKLLNTALDAGLNIIDTAECYINSEEMIGNSIAGRRTDFYLFTKCGHPNGYETPDWSKEGIAKQIDTSLKRLKTDYLDLVQLHSCDESELRKGDVIEALQTARQAGKTRFIGYSGDSLAAKYAIECGAFDTLQTSVSIADQEALDLTIPLAKKADMGVIAKRPVANAAWRYKSKPDNDYHLPYWERLNDLQYDFINGDVSGPIDIALRFTLMIPGVHTAIVGTTKPERWNENAKLVERGPLSSEEFDRIRARWKNVAKPNWVGQT